MRVLVVEDEQSVASAVKRALGADGYDVDVASDGAHGLELARRERYDAIVLDVMIPNVNGYDLCRRLRAGGNRTPIIMLTAKAGERDIVEGFDLGADDYLTKPFSMAVLLAHVRARTRRAGHAAVLVSGDLRLDVAARRCWRGDVEIELTGREAKLLGELFRRRGEIVTKAELVGLVWGDRFRGHPNVVEVYIGRLRRKLDDPFATSDIETIRGVGYRFHAPEPSVMNR